MSTDRPTQRAISLYVLAVVASALTLVWYIVERSDAVLLPENNRVAFALFAVMVFVGETQPRFWMRFGDDAEVTPGWAFAYALMLLGSPIAAMIAMGLATAYADSRDHHGDAIKIVFNVSQVTLSIAAGSLVLEAFGVTGSIAGHVQMPASVSVGIAVGGLTTLLVNTMLTVFVISLHQRMPLPTVLRASFAVTLAVDGALLALAPLFVIAVDVSLLMLPLLGITSFLVFHSARTAMRREHEANHDPLTLLLNRRAFDERLQAALDGADAQRRPVVLVMDLDRFKDINDRLGHLVGDRLLCSFAERLERNLPQGASASRLGGDEFAVVLPHMASLDEAKGFVTRLHALLSHQHDLSGFPLSAAVSIGVAMAPNNGRSSQALMAAADLAMYRAKQFGSGIELATAGDSPQDVGRVSLLSDLSAAIGTDQLYPHYQPLVRLDNGIVESVEALIRWNHPVYGNVPPSEFIAMAEQTDLIDPITESMLRMTITDMLSLGDAMPKLSVNVAARNLLDRRFASMVLSIVNEHRFPAHMLEIEITERDILTNSERGALAIERLRAHGVQIAIDDFGTGYSSFLSLRDLSADRLKIDQQFTARISDSPADELIVTKVIEIAHTLGLDVVAEGVESETVWRRLAQLGCDVAQGYAIARPMPFDALRSWIAEQSPRVEPEPESQPKPAAEAAQSEVLAS